MKKRRVSRPRNHPWDKNKIQKGIRFILEGLGEDLKKTDLRTTPQKVACFYEEFFQKNSFAPQKLLKLYPHSRGKKPLALKAIPFYSLCRHHLLPFFGKVSIVYVPAVNKIFGFSSVARMIESLSQRLQLQEKLTVQIADSLQKALPLEALLVTVEAEHLCISMRGVKKPHMTSVTTETRGDFKNKALSSAILAWLKQ